MGTPLPIASWGQTSLKENPAFGALMAHGIFLLVTPKHPNDLSPRRPTKHISVFENYLESHPVSHLKTTNIAKQIKLLWGSGVPTGHIHHAHDHLQCTTMATLSLSLSFPAEERGQGRAPQQRGREWRVETMSCTRTSSLCTCIRSCKGPHFPSATTTGSRVLSPPLPHLILPLLR